MNEPKLYRNGYWNGNLIKDLTNRHLKNVTNYLHRKLEEAEINMTPDGSSYSIDGNNYNTWYNIKKTYKHKLKEIIEETERRLENE